MNKTPHLDLLEHYCLENTIFNLITVPEALLCESCRLRVLVDHAAQLSIDKASPVCPHCGKAMTVIPSQTMGELHTQLCTDKYKHYPDLRTAGTVTEAEFQSWVATLTPEEKRGRYCRVPTSLLIIQLTHDEVSLKDTDPKRYEDLICAKLTARAELILAHNKAAGGVQSASQDPASLVTRMKKG